MISYTDRSSFSIFQFYYDLLTGFDAVSEFFLTEKWQKSVVGLTFSGVALSNLPKISFVSAAF